MSRSADDDTSAQNQNNNIEKLKISEKIKSFFFLKYFSS